MPSYCLVPVEWSSRRNSYNANIVTQFRDARFSDDVFHPVLTPANHHVIGINKKRVGLTLILLGIKAPVEKKVVKNSGLFFVDVKSSDLRAIISKIILTLYVFYLVSWRVPHFTSSRDTSSQDMGRVARGQTTTPLFLGANYRRRGARAYRISLINVHTEPLVVILPAYPPCRPRSRSSRRTISRIAIPSPMRNNVIPSTPSKL